MLCEYFLSESSPYHTLCKAASCIRFPFIFFLLVGTLHGLAATQTGSGIPTHSNFFRSTLRGRERVLWCANDASVCLDREKNPWGGNTCCFQKFCKDIMSDLNHCGTCGQACAYGLVCCDGKCVDVNKDPKHCGSCFEECPGQNRCLYAMCDYGG